MGPYSKKDSKIVWITTFLDKDFVYINLTFGCFIETILDTLDTYTNIHTKGKFMGWGNWDFEKGGSIE